MSLYIAKLFKSLQARTNRPRALHGHLWEPAWKFLPFPGLGRGFGLFQCGSTAVGDDPLKKNWSNKRSNWKIVFVGEFFLVFQKHSDFFLWISKINFLPEDYLGLDDQAVPQKSVR